jgi:general secretion pathway protein A
MRSLVGEIATLELGDQPLRIGSAALEQLWNGEYLMLWRLQTSYHLIGPGSWGEPVQWLRERLAIVEGESETFPLNMEFDGALAERVRHFQRANELEPDGIVGARTMVLLNNLAPGPGTPLLISPAREGA